MGLCNGSKVDEHATHNLKIKASISATRTRRENITKIRPSQTNIRSLGFTIAYSQISEQSESGRQWQAPFVARTNRKLIRANKLFYTQKIFKQALYFCVRQ
jgi:hypothetical protein